MACALTTRPPARQTKTILIKWTARNNQYQSAKYSKILKFERPKKKVTLSKDNDKWTWTPIHHTQCVYVTMATRFTQSPIDLWLQLLTAKQLVSVPELHSSVISWYLDHWRNIMVIGPGANFFFVPRPKHKHTHTYTLGYTHSHSRELLLSPCRLKRRKKVSVYRPGRDIWETECTVCKAGTYVSVSNKGAGDLTAHMDLKLNFVT